MLLIDFSIFVNDKSNHTGVNNPIILAFAPDEEKQDSYDATLYIENKIMTRNFKKK